MKAFLSKLLLAATLTVGFASCGSSVQFSDAKIKKQIANLKSGMTEDEVLNLMGTPDDKLLVNGRETWKWNHYVFLDQSTKTIEVGFIDGRVEYINTHYIVPQPQPQP